MIFANHAHVFPKDVREDGTVERLLVLMEECGIERAVTFAPFSSQVPGDPNQWLARAIKPYPNLVGFGTIDPSGDRPLADQAQDIAQLGFKGVKLHPAFQQFAIMDQALMDFYSQAQELGLFLSFHSGIHWHRIRDYHPLLFDELAYHFPRLRFSMEHIGGLSFFQDALAVLSNNTPPGQRGTVYAGVTSVLNAQKNQWWYLGPERLELVERLIGASQMIFGLDFPYNQIPETQESIAAIRAMKIPQASKDLILGGTLSSLVI